MSREVEERYSKAADSVAGAFTRERRREKGPVGLWQMLGC